MAHTFPPEIIREILLRASVKSLLRCKLVCKEWYSLISSEQNFINSHYTLSSTNNINYQHHRLIYKTLEYENDLISCPLYDVLFDKSVNNLENPLQQPQPQEVVGIVGSCNGLVCLLVLAEDDDALFIYNPSTRRTNSLPRSKQGASSFWVSYGFGYHETTHDYKVVKIRCCDQTSPSLYAMIYSLKAGSWKEIGGFPGVYPRNNGKFLNGALHWETGDATWPDSLDIVSLDLGKETYGEVLQPECGEGSKILTLGVWGEWLCVLCNYHVSRVVDVWVMKVYGVKDSWTKLACIPHPTKLACIPHPTTWSMDLDILCSLKDGKVLLRFGPQLLVYDSKDSSSREIENFDEIDDACVVVESLVSAFPPLALANDNEN